MKSKSLKLNSGLWLDLYELAMAQVYFRYKRDCKVSFELFIRSEKRPFYVVYGIREALEYLADLKFTSQDLDYLRSLKLFDEGFLNYLKKFRFKGEVWAVEEPEIVFAGEPILRVTANIIEAQIVESVLLNTLNLYTTLATKSCRVVLSAQGRKIYDFSLRRTQGQSASLAAASASFVVGAEGTSNVLAGLIYGIPVVGTMAHSYVMTFSSEFDSFYLFSKTFPEKSILLIDTYDINSALESVVRLSSYLKKERQKILGVRIDSGNLVEISKYVRSYLDRAGLIDVIIFASGNLDEYKIKELIEKKAPIDAFGVGTNMGTSSDLPFSDVIYKLVEVGNLNGEFLPVMKLSSEKTTYPLRKQVFRKFAQNKLIKQDYIGLLGENLGKPLLRKVMGQGEILQPKQDLNSQRAKFKKKIESLPSFLKEIHLPQITPEKALYPVAISNKLEKITKSTQELIKKRSRQKKIIFVDIDTQYDFVDRRGALYVKEAEKLKAVWSKLTKFAYNKGILIISSQDTHKKKDPEFKSFPPHCIRESWGYKKIPQTLLPNYQVLSFEKRSFEELFRIKEDFPQIILEKNVLNIFSNPNAEELLKVILPEQVYVYGLVTEFCVKEAVLGFKKFVDEVFVIEDALKEIDPKAKEQVFREFKNKGIKFIKTDEVWEKFKDF